MEAIHTYKRLPVVRKARFLPTMRTGTGGREPGHRRLPPRDSHLRREPDASIIILCRSRTEKEKAPPLSWPGGGLWAELRGGITHTIHTTACQALLPTLCHIAAAEAVLQRPAHKKNRRRGTLCVQPTSKEPYHAHKNDQTDHCRNFDPRSIEPHCRLSVRAATRSCRRAGRG